MSLRLVGPLRILSEGTYFFNHRLMREVRGSVMEELGLGMVVAVVVSIDSKLVRKAEQSSVEKVQHTCGCSEVKQKQAVDEQVYYSKVAVEH